MFVVDVFFVVLSVQPSLPLPSLPLINFNAGEQRAVVYTRDKAVMRKLDALVIAFPEVYKLVGETDIDKTYSMPKSCVNYRKPRKLDDKYRELKRTQMKQYNMQR